MQVKELGHVVLYVHDLERSRHFYGDVLGFRQLPMEGSFAAAAFSSVRSHHELLLIEVGEDAAEIPAVRRVGMYHIGLKIGDSDDELRAAVVELDRAGVELVGASDHTVTHSLYLRDPDGNELELFIDVPGVNWRENPELISAPIKPLHL